ncbi:SDR family NAD(P)-dependent oxidoreductase [Vibrio sonorensis]|uniref:SDR family NAD(P)-dependent oxidoreductase n=1 Tax=Vibrio sonorensis TaxID=1004316 RepID=UPI0008DAFDE3|nr:SDR family NAD(P)-dependent oxidoreductase [Vibrio sonorensis]
MKKTILLTGATDGIGLETAKQLVTKGHHLLLHGRNPEKLSAAVEQLKTLSPTASIEPFVADLSRFQDIEQLVSSIAQKHKHLDVIINNAGVFSTSSPMTLNGLDVRFVVNTIAPYLITKGLIPLMGNQGRIVNVSSAAQTTVDLAALKGQRQLSDNAAYAQSKLAIIMWTNTLTAHQKLGRPLMVSVNPASMLGSKMVTEAYGVVGGDLSIGADILTRAALSSEFDQADGLYFDNDLGKFAKPHPDALDQRKAKQVTDTIDRIVSELGVEQI